MGYEREAMPDAASAVTNQSVPEIRAERVIDPHSHATRMAKVMAKMSGQVEQPNTSGTTQAVDTATPEATVTLSPQVAALARREQKFRKNEQALKAREAAIEAKLANIARLEAMETKLKAKDYSGLDDLVDYNEYSQYQVNKLNGSDPTQDAIRALSAKIEGIEKSQEESTSKLFESLVQERRNLVTKLVETSPDFSSLKKLGMQEHVVQHILDTWEHESVELSVEDAAKEIKEELTARKKRLDDAFAPDVPPVVEQKKPLPPLKAGIKTITNQVTTSEATQPRKSLQHMSDSERWAEARRRAEAKLQKQG
jgi:hypothetical protein